MPYLKGRTADSGSIGGVTLPIVITCDEQYQVSQNDYTILANTEDRDVNLYLPCNPAEGQKYEIKKISNSYDLRIVGNGNQIDKMDEIFLTEINEKVKLQFAPSYGWVVL